MLRALLLALAFVGCYGGPSQLVLNTPGQPRPHGHLGKCESSNRPLGTTYTTVESPPLEIYPLVVSGPTSNRIDLVFFSDGYLLEERDKFIQDATRLAEDISTNQTFVTVKPLLNFWAAFAPSQESGIGVGGKPKDTPFGLYRDGTELRGVYYSKPEVAAAACESLGDQCDYPILLGNDPYYGGLGGDFTVITSSLANGPLVLRHELGHSIIDVGEEYDGGPAYFGVNAYHNLTAPVPWAHWLPHDHVHSPPRVEQSIMPMQRYPWTLLNTSEPWSTTFSSAGTYPRHLIKFSLSGLPVAADLRVELDGISLDWAPRKHIGLDRWHYDIPRDTRLAPGPHEIKFILTNKDRVGVAQLCSVEVLEFEAEDKFISTPGNYGVYPTFSDKNETSYRPTNDDCLMRSVITPNFCKVCIEGLWHSLLRRVSLIDGFADGCEPQSTGEWVRTLDLTLIPLAQFRTQSATHETYTIKWWKDNKLLTEFTNKTRLALSDADAAGTYSVGVTFTTDEVRVDKYGVLSANFTYQLAGSCDSAA